MEMSVLLLLIPQKGDIKSLSQEYMYRKKLKEEQTCEEYKSMVRDKVEQEEWKHLDVNEHWRKMKKIMMETAQHICGMSKGQVLADIRKHGGGMRRLLKQ